MRGIANIIKTVVTGALLLAICSALRSQTVPANVGPVASSVPRALQNVGFRPSLNAQMPIDVPFRDERSQEVRLRDYLGHKPLILTFVYFNCPMLCDQVQQGVVGSLRMLSFNPGRDYDVVFVSFDPSDTPEGAAEKKKQALSHFRRPETASGWHFLTGSQDSIDTVTHAATFRYEFDSRSGMFAHAAGVLLLTPDGRISRYFYGVEYPARDMRLGLVDASAGKIGNPIDYVLLYCYHYDPTAATYSASILKIMRLGGILTIICIVGGILIFRRRETAMAAGESSHRLQDTAERGAH